MSKIKFKIFPIIFALTVASFFLIFFKFERKINIFSNILSGVEKLEKVKVLHVGQRFKIEGNSKGFNSISVSLFNPTLKRLVCDFIIKKEKNGKPIIIKKIVIKKQTNMYNLEKIDFPHLNFKGHNIFYFELISHRHPFFINKYSKNIKNRFFKTFIENKDREGTLQFCVSDYQEHSIISFLFQTDSKTQKKCIVLILLSFFELLLAGFLLSKVIYSDSRILKTFRISHRTECKEIGESVNRLNISILTILALFLFSVIFISFLIGNNTYAKVLGANDDAFITYKYAKNISEGNGFRFNTDEKVLGTTSPFYSLLLSFLGFFTGEIHIISLVLNLISIFFSGIIVYLLLSKYLPSFIALGGGTLFIFFPMFYRIIGMETNFVIFLIILSLFLFNSEKYSLSFTIIGLATLTRLESALLIPLLVLSMLFRKDFKNILKALAIYLLVISPWFVFSYYYFGQLLPNTFYIKTNFRYAEINIFKKIYNMITYITGLKFLKSVFLKGFLSVLSENVQYFKIWILLFLTTSLLSIKYFFKINFIRLYLFWVLLYVISYSILQTPNFIWYYVLALSIIPIILALGINRIFELFKGRFKVNRVIFLVAFLFFLLTVFEGKNVFNIFYGKWYSLHIPHLERFETYIKVSNYINRNVPVEKTIGTEEIGIVGYYSRNKIWDFYSLIHKADKFSSYLPNDRVQHIPYLLVLMDPDYLILNSFHIKNHIAYQNYKEVKMFPVEEFKRKFFFYYSLLKKKKNHFNLLGNVQINKKLTGKMKILGWVFGTEEIKSVEILMHNNVISKTNTFDLSAKKSQELFNFNINRFSKRGVFLTIFNSIQLDNGIHEFVFQANTASKKGVFWRGKVEIEN